MRRDVISGGRKALFIVRVIAPSTGDKEEAPPLQGKGRW